MVEFNRDTCFGASVFVKKPGDLTDTQNRQLEIRAGLACACEGTTRLEKGCSNQTKNCYATLGGNRLWRNSVARPGRSAISMAMIKKALHQFRDY